jgi:hypothetical protein
MVSEAETRGVLDYLLQRRDVAAVLTFGEGDNLIGAPTRRGEPAPASTLDLVALTNDRLAGARQVGIFRPPPPPCQLSTFAGITNTAEPTAGERASAGR